MELTREQNLPANQPSPPGGQFRHGLIVPGTGYTHQELFAEKTVDWMQSKQVLGCVDEMVNIYPYLKVHLSDVIWRQIYLNIRAVSNFTTQGSSQRHYSLFYINVFKINIILHYFRNFYILNLCFQC